MANFGQAVLSIGGAFIGGMIGGPAGAAWGFQLGSLAGQALFPTDLGTIRGPRLDDLKVMSSAIGAPIPIVYGTYAVAGNVIFSSGLIETVTKDEVGGKGGPTQTVKTYSYSADFAVGICEGPIQGIKRIWADAVVIYDLSPQGATETDDDFAKRVAATEQTISIMTLYLGGESQLADPTIESYEGVGNVPAYRGLAYVVFEAMQLEKFGNRIPNLRFEVYAGTYTAEDCTQYDNEVLYPWFTTLQNPTNSLNLNDYRRDQGGSGDWETWAEAKADVEATTGTAFSSYVYGWGFSNNTTAVVYPHEGAMSSENRILRLWINRTQVGTLNGHLDPLANGCALAAANFDNSLEWWDGNRDPDPHSFHGIWWYDAAGSTPGGMPAYDVGGNCGGASHYLVWQDRNIEVRRSPTAPLNTADDPDYTAIPGAPGFFFNSAGTIVRGVTWAYDASTTYKVLQAYASTGADTAEVVTAYPLGPARPLGHAEYNDQAFWESAYAAAVAAGDISSSPTLVYGVDYPVTQGYAYIGTCTTGTVDTDCVLIADVVTDLCERAGLTAIDVSDLTTCIDGYCVTRVMTARDAIDPLRTVGLFDAVESDGVLRFVERGHAEAATLSVNDLAAHSSGDQRPTSVSVSRKQEKELPRRVRFHYTSPERAYEPGEQAAARVTTNAVSDLDLEVAVAMTDERAAELAEVHLYLAWVGRNTYSFALDNSWLKLEPTDCVLLPVDDGLERVRFTGVGYSIGGVAQVEATRDDDGNYTSSAVPSTPSASGGQGTPSTQLICPSEIVLLDIPALRSEDTDAGYYAAVYGLCDTWSCAVIYRSSDSGTTYGRVGETSVEATVGSITTNVDALQSPWLQATTGSPLVFDESAVVYVTLESGTSLSSATEATLLAGGNTAAIGADGRWEIIQFRDAVLQSGDVWALSGLWRGLLGTEANAGTTVAGDTFVLLTAPGIVRIPETQSGIGVSKLIKAVTCGSSLDATTAVSFTTQGLSYNPPPTTIGGQDDADLDTVIDGQLMRYNATTGKWEPWTLAMALVDLSDVTVGSPIAEGDVPAWDTATEKFVLQPQTGSVGGSPGAETFDPRYTHDYFDDFVSDMASNGLWQPTIGGTGSVTYASTADHPGVIRCSRGTTAGNTAQFFSGLPTSAVGKYLLTTNALTVEWLIRIDTIPDGTNNFEVACGLRDQSGGTQRAMAVVSRSGSPLTLAWELRTQNGGATTTTVSAAAPTSNTWHLVKIVATTSQVDLYVDGVSIATNTTEIPTSGMTLFGGIFGIAGTTNRMADFDFVWTRQSYPSGRY